MSERPPSRVIIVGAGPAGMATALLLKDADPNLPVVVLNRTRPRPFRTAETLPPCAEPLLKRLQVWEAFLLGAHRTLTDRLVGVVRMFEWERPDEGAKSGSYVESCEHGWWSLGWAPGGKAIVAFMTDDDLAIDLGLRSEIQWDAWLGATTHLKDKAPSIKRSNAGPNPCSGGGAIELLPRARHPARSSVNPRWLQPSSHEASFGVR